MNNILTKLQNIHLFNLTNIESLILLCVAILIVIIGVIFIIFGYGRRTKKISTSIDQVQKTVQSAQPMTGLKKFFLSLSGKSINQEVLTALEKVLIQSDIGPKVTQRLLRGLQVKGSGDELKQQLQRAIVDCVQPYVKSLTNLSMNTMQTKSFPYMILMVGLNGTGKTTTIAKLVYQLRDQYKILLAAGDIFRAGALEQLQTWATKLKVPVVSSNSRDMAAVAYQAYDKACMDGNDVIIMDTAGRQHTNTNLMNELKKTYTVLQKKNQQCPAEIWLVIDGNVGQNALNQVDKFVDALPVTGLIVTKLDGLAKGGIILSLVDTYKLPIMGIGLGEKMEDFEELDPQEFAKRLLNV